MNNYGANISKSAREIFEVVVKDGREDLDRASTSIGKDRTS
jgi:hypothetical protein